jgi:hypothetical protein
MGLQFDRPVGAPLDVAELEYCAALRQCDTSRPLRANGSVTAADVRLHILSRHGVNASVHDIERLLMVQLAGGQEYSVRVAPSSPRHRAITVSKDSTAPQASLPNHEGTTAEPKEGVTEGGGGRGGGGGESEGADKLRISIGEGEDTVYSTGGDDDASLTTSHKKSDNAMLVSRVTPLDLVQQVALLLVPELKKLSDAEKEKEEDNGHRLAASVARGGLTEDEEAGGAISAPPLASSARPSLAASRNSANGAPASSSRRTGSGFRQSVRNLFVDNAAKEELPPCIDKSAVEVALLVLLENAGLVYNCELTTDVIHQLLISLGEEYWTDDVIEQMVHLAKGGGGTSSNDDDDEEPPLLNADTFLRALTADLGMYDSRTELRVTTHYADVNAAPAPTKSEATASSLSSPSPSSPPPLERVFTASSIDYTADTYASLTWAVLVWFLLAGFFFLYMFNGLSRRMFPLGCNDEEFGCKIANAVVLWLEIMIKLCIVGFIYIASSTLGNSVYLLTGDNSTAPSKATAAITIAVSVATVFASTLLAYLVQVDAFVFDTDVPAPDDDVGGTLYLGDDPALAGTTIPPKQPPAHRQVDVLLGATLALGLICMLAQLAQLVRAVLPRHLAARSSILSGFMRSSASTMEHRTKIAASHKVREMVRHAVSCHALTTSPADAGGLATSVKYEAKNVLRLVAQNVDGRISHALFQFQERLQDRETVGGLLYTINGLFRNGNPLATKEGVWIFPRLLWCNLGQWIVVIAIVVGLVQIPIALSEGFELDGISVQQYVVESPPPCGSCRTPTAAYVSYLLSITLQTAGSYRSSLPAERSASSPAWGRSPGSSRRPSRPSSCSGPASTAASGTTGASTCTASPKTPAPPCSDRPSGASCSPAASFGSSCR